MNGTTMRDGGIASAARRLVGVALTALLFTATAHAQELGIEVGAAAPDAALETLDGAAAPLRPAIAGKPAVLYFWATWCSNCRELEPTLTAAVQKHGTNVAFAAIAVSVNQSTERVKRYTADHYAGWKHFYDRRGNGVEVYDVPATSYVVVVDRAGKVVYTGVGGKQDIEAAIQKALK